MTIAVFPLPSFLTGVLTLSRYNAWLNSRAQCLLFRDRHRKKPFALKASKADYRTLIHDAVMHNGQIDPYTGDALDWGLIGSWDDADAAMDVFEKRFALMPTVDHTDPRRLGFEICSFIINCSKDDLDSAEYIALCAKVVAFRGSGLKAAIPKEADGPDSRFKKYLLPPFLSGTMTLRAYNNWLNFKAHNLFIIDKKRGKAFALAATREDYKKQIHRAATAGQFDPFTGEALRWDLVGKYDTDAAHDIGDEYKREFFLMPTIDHTDPNALGFEMCSWLVNECKSFCTSEGFVELCGRIVEYRLKNAKIQTVSLSGRVVHMFAALRA